MGVLGGWVFSYERGNPVVVQMDVLAAVQSVPGMQDVNREQQQEGLVEEEDVCRRLLFLQTHSFL